MVRSSVSPWSFEIVSIERRARGSWRSPNICSGKTQKHQAGPNQGLLFCLPFREVAMTEN